MVEDVKKILSTDIEEIIKTSMSLLLLRCYSLLYMSGRQTQTCANSQRKYYEQLKVNGVVMAEKKDKEDNKTCVLKNEGLRLLPPVRNAKGELIKAHCHIDGKTLTDEQAIELLTLGALKESDFKILPKDYEKKSKSKKSPTDPSDILK